MADCCCTVPAFADTSMQTEPAPPTPESPVRERNPSISNRSSSAGPVTPQSTLKRRLPDDFDAPATNTELVAAPPAAKKARSIASTFGLVVLGAALGSVGTIAGLTQLAD